MGACILDIDNPSMVKHRASSFILTPETWYEERGFVANVVFPCAALTDAETGRIAIYYGAADSYVGMAFTTIDEIVTFIKEHDGATDDDKNFGVM